MDPYGDCGIRVLMGSVRDCGTPVGQGRLRSSSGAGGSHGSGNGSPRLVLVAPRRAALGTPLGLLVAAVGPVTGTVTAWPEGSRGAGPCAPPTAFSLTSHNDFNQLLHIEVQRHGGTGGHPCGVQGLWHILYFPLCPHVPPMLPYVSCVPSVPHGPPYLSCPPISLHIRPCHFPIPLPVPMFPASLHVSPVSPCPLQVTPAQAERCGVLRAARGRVLLLEARSTQLPPPGTRLVRVALGGSRGHLIIQTDKPLYAPRQTGEPLHSRSIPDLPPPPPIHPNVPHATKAKKNPPNPFQKP